MKYYIVGNTIHVKYKPLYIDQTLEYWVDKPCDNATPIHFKTATSSMKALKKKSGEVVIEHLDVHGKMGYLPYQGAHLGNLNFINFGWKYHGGRKYIRIDAYTGESLIVEESAQ